MPTDSARDSDRLPLKDGLRTGFDLRHFHPVLALAAILYQIYRRCSPKGLAHWADHCAICHANDGSGDTPICKRVYPPAPDMRLSATQRMTDGELFFIIRNGIRLSAMPAWDGGIDPDSQVS